LFELESSESADGYIEKVAGLFRTERVGVKSNSFGPIWATAVPLHIYPYRWVENVNGGNFFRDSAETEETAELVR
jgi:hypothetical protein